MTDRIKLALARGFAYSVELHPDDYDVQETAAAKVIRSLPDSWVDADELREWIDSTIIGGRPLSETMLGQRLKSFLPAPPAPRTMAEIEWDYEEHHMAEATAAWRVGDPSKVVMLNKVGEKINVYKSTPYYKGLWEVNPDMLTPTGRKYRLEPEGEGESSPEPASPRPDGCCGKCPPIVGGGYDCTCADNPRCQNHKPHPEDVPVGEAWQVEAYENTAIGYRNDPKDRLPWTIVYRDTAEHDWLYDEDVTLVARLVPEATEQGYDAMLDPAYTYLDRDGDEWECINGGWIAGYTHAERVAARETYSGRSSMPEWFGPYTRVEPEFDPAYTYRDRRGDEWEHLDGKWVTGDTHAKRVAKRILSYGQDVLPAEYGPYTRIEKEEPDA